MKSHYFIFALLLFTAATAFSKPVRVTSFKNNFVIIAPSHELANSLASECESFRQDFLKRFEWKQDWKKPVQFSVVPGAGKKKKTLELVDNILSLKVSVPQKGDYFWDYIAPEIIRFALINQAGLKKEKLLGNIYKDIPYWFIRGMIVRADARSLPDYAVTVRKRIFSGKYMPVGELFKLEGPRADREFERAVGYQSACLVEYLSHLEKGNERLRSFVSSLNGNEKWRDVFFSVYSKDFKNEAEINDSFVRSLRGPNRISVNAPRMNYSDSLELLNHAMAVRAAPRGGAMEEAGYVQDLKSFKNCCKEEIARRELMAAYPAVIKLKFEGDEQLQGLIDKYIKACTMSGADRNNFWKAFIEAETERKNRAEGQGIKNLSP